MEIELKTVLGFSYLPSRVLYSCVIPLIVTLISLLFMLTLGV